MKTLFIRTLIGGVFLVSLFCVVIAAGGAWLLIEGTQRADTVSMHESCEKAVERGDYTEIDPCLEDSMKAFGIFGFALIAAVISGVLSLVFLVVGIISLRRHRQRIRMELRETP